MITKQSIVQTLLNNNRVLAESSAALAGIAGMNKVTFAGTGLQTQIADRINTNNAIITQLTSKEELK